MDTKNDQKWKTNSKHNSERGFTLMDMVICLMTPHTEMVNKHVYEYYLFRQISDDNAYLN